MRLDAVLRQARALTRGRSGSLSRTVTQAHAGLVLTFAVLIALPTMASSGLPTLDLFARWGIVLTFFVVAAWMLRSGERVAQLIVVLAASALIAPILMRHHIPGETAAGILITAAALLGARVLVPWAAAVNVLVAWTVFGVAAAAAGRIARETVGIEDFALATAMAMSAVGFVNSLESLAQRANDTAAFTRTRRRELLQSEAEAEATSQAQRVLHDEVLGTLTLIGNGQVRDVEVVRAHCRKAVDSIAKALHATPQRGDTAAVESRLTHNSAAYGDMLARVVELAPVTVDVETDATATSAIAQLSQSRADALERAVMEALRNVAQHSGESSATVRVSADRQNVELIVCDEGVGMASDAKPGFGLVHSINGAMVAAGGAASFDSTPRRGTTLTLRMPRGRLSAGWIEQTYTDTVSGFGVLPLATRSVVLPMLSAFTLIGGYQAIVAPNPVLSLMVAVGWLTLSLVVLNRVERRAPTSRWVVIVSAVVCLLQVAGLLLIEPGALLDYRSWSAGFSAAALVLLAFVLPVRVGLLLLLAQPALILVAAWLSPELSNHEFPFGAVNAPITAPLAALLLGVLVRRTSRKTAERTATATALEHALLLERTRVETSALYFEYSRAVVLPWLAGVADGEIDPMAPDAQGRARLLAMAARDDLYAPGFLDDSLRDQVAGFRQGGGSVELRNGLAAGGSRRWVGRLLGDLLPISDGHRIIVSPVASRDAQVRISVVPPPPGQELTRVTQRVGDRLRTDVDDFRAVLVLEDLPVLGE